MSVLGNLGVISKPIKVKPLPFISKLFAELRKNGWYISPKEESCIRTSFLAWILENKKSGIRKSKTEKKKKFHEITTTILKKLRLKGIFDDLSDIEQENSIEYPEESSFNIPETIEFQWMDEKVPKKMQFQEPTLLLDSIPEPSLSNTLLQILRMNLKIHNYFR